MSIKPTTVPSKRLTASITGASTSIQLNNILGWDGVALTASDFGSTLFVVLRNDTNTAMELVELDPSTIANSSITITRRGLKFTGDNTTEVAGNKLTWIKNETIVELGSDTPQLFQWLKDYIDNATVSGAPDASTTVKGLVQEATSAEIDANTGAGSTSARLYINPERLAASQLGANIPTTDQKAALAGSSGTPSISNKFVTQTDTTFTPTGIISPYAGRSAPTGWLVCDGSAVSRTTYANLLAAICPSQTFTVTSASPAVFTATAHGLVIGDKIHLTTTGGLYSGITANTDYYIIAAGLTADAFEVALSPGGTAINTSGSQSGVHTVYKAPWGKGDGSTTFNIPDLRSMTVIGRSATAPTTVLTWDPAQRSSNAITILDTVFPSQGQAVVLSTTGTLPTGLSPGTYYIIRVSSTSISFATSQANANDGTAISLSGDGSGIHTMTFTNRVHTVLGRKGGEESHGLATAELSSHQHLNNDDGAGENFGITTTGGGSRFNTAGGGGQYIATPQSTVATGGDGLHNIMSPFAVINYIIKT
jgi:microcystin-dependent protein